MPPPSALLEAHQEIVGRLRELVGAAMPDDVLLPVEIPRNLQEALRELDRLEGVARDFEAEADRLAGMLQEEAR